jgi:hypothetical protein
MIESIRRPGLRLLTVACLSAVSASYMFATPISGEFHFAGTAVVSQFALDFIPPAAGGVGTITTVAGANTGDFTTLNGADAFSKGQIKDRPASQEVGTPGLNVANYLMLDALPNFQFTLQQIRVGSYTSTQCFAPAANQQTCTLPSAGTLRSPYNLSNFIDSTGVLSSSATFSVEGDVMNTLTSETGTFSGVFEAVFKGRSYQDVVGQVLGGGSVNAPFSATFTVSPTAIPEPSTTFQLVSGALLLGFSGFLKRRARS